MNLYRHVQPDGSARRAGQMSRLCGPTAAFTMVEIAMALAVIGFAVVAILGILPMGMDVQKDNRRETIINQDANFLIETIRGGARGVDDLTNYVTAITNVWAFVREDGKLAGPPNTCIGTNDYSYTNSRVTSGGGLVLDTMPLNNGTRIVGLLSTPKYLTNGITAALGVDNKMSVCQSNYIIANVRAISGVALEKFPQNSDLIKGSALSYRLVSELTPYGGTSNGMYYSAWTNYLDPNVIKSAAIADINKGVANWVWGLNQNTNANPEPVYYLTNYGVTVNVAGMDVPAFRALANRWLVTRNLEPNLYELRLVFRWPLFPGNRIGNGRQVYRAMISGSLTNDTSGTNSGWFMRPQNYVYQQAP